MERKGLANGAYKQIYLKLTWHYDPIDIRDLFHAHVRVSTHCDRCSNHPDHDHVPYRVWWIRGDVGAMARSMIWHWLWEKERKLLVLQTYLIKA